MATPKQIVNSYIFSVAVAPEITRNIRISANATFADLSDAILKAFDFDNDHAHAFFMSGRCWDEDTAIYCDYIYSDGASSSEVQLRDLNMRRGKRFLYLFDFGDEWLFECRLKDKLAEHTAAPVVVASVGEAPEQYPPEDDWDDADEGDDPEDLTSRFPHIFTKEEIRRVLSQMDDGEDLPF